MYVCMYVCMHAYMYMYGTHILYVCMYVVAEGWSSNFFWTSLKVSRASACSARAPSAARARRAATDATLAAYVRSTPLGAIMAL